jgi:hypothetical protein
MNKMFILYLLLFMNKMFILYFALLQSGRGTTKKNRISIYKFMFKYVERRKFTETTSESASYTYTVRVHYIYNKK